MKQFFLTTLTVLTAIIISSCSDGIKDLDSSVQAETIVTNHLSMDQAKTRLQRIITQPAIAKGISKSTTRANCMDIDGGIAFDKNGQLLTRSEEDSAYYYVFGIDNSGGYAIMGARFPLPELIALCSGSNSVSEASLEDIKKNGLTIANLPNNLSSIIAIDSISIGGGETDLNFIYDYNNITYTIDVKPITNKWGQGAPFNLTIKEFLGEDYVIGCPSLATAMVLMGDCNTSDYYFDESGYEYYWDWNSIRQYPYNLAFEDGYGDETVATSILPNLFYELGKPRNLNIMYGVEASGIYTDSAYTNVPRTFKIRESELFCIG